MTRLRSLAQMMEVLLDGQAIFRRRNRACGVMAGTSIPLCTDIQ